MVELVRTLAQVRDAQDDQFGLATRELPAGHQPAGEAQPAAEQGGPPRHGEEQVRRVRLRDTSGESTERPRKQPDLLSGARRDSRGHVIAGFAARSMAVLKPRIAATYTG